MKEMLKVSMNFFNYIFFWDVCWQDLDPFAWAPDCCSGSFLCLFSPTHLHVTQSTPWKNGSLISRNEVLKSLGTNPETQSLTLSPDHPRADTENYQEFLKLRLYVKMTRRMMEHTLWNKNSMQFLYILQRTFFPGHRPKIPRDLRLLALGSASMLQTGPLLNCHST